MKPFKFILCIHRILGTVLSILFLMWFLSGMVMMYHTYPSLNEQQRMAHAEPLSACEAIPSLQPPTAPSSPLWWDARGASLQQIAGSPVLTLTTSDGETLLDARTGQPVTRFSPAELLTIATRWQSPTPSPSVSVGRCTTATNPPLLLDTLTAIDIWLIGAMPFKEYPIYHYALNDGKGSELYLSSRTGRPLQLTDSKSRFWAWVGAIPHWIYITKLRATGRQPWTNTVLWLSGFGILMTLSGIIIGLRSLRLARRKRNYSPYTKPFFRWHHLFGLAFGFFVLTWIFSGFMSLADAPQLVWPTHEDHSARDIYADSLQFDRFTLDVNRVLAGDDVRRVDWQQMGPYSFYHVWTANDEYLVDATDTLPHRLALSTQQCLNIVRSIPLQQKRLSEVELLTHYDNYYVSQKHPLPLPVCKVTVADDDHSTYYINPKTGECRYYNSNRRAGKWMYTGLHALNIPFFVEHPALRLTILWVLLLGGTAVSVTGLVLAIRYIRRLIRKRPSSK